MKRNAIAICALILAACGGGTGNEVPAEQPTLRPSAPVEAPKMIIVEMYGDSTTEGTAAASEPLYLQQLLGDSVKVINEGVGGTTAGWLLAGTDTRHLPFVQVMANSKADIVTINFGLNDILTTTPDGFATDLYNLVEIALRAGKRVVLQEPNPTCLPQRAGAIGDYVRKINVVASMWNVPVVHQYSQLPDWKDHTPDCLHPDDSLYREKAANTYTTIKGMLR